MQKKAPCRKFHQTVILWLAALFLGFPAAFAMDESPLSIAGKMFTVEIASTDKEQQTGLMYRKSLAEDRGMLFVFQEPQLAAMWMKNTLIPLDMLFIDEKGTVIYIEHNAKPESTDIITAGTEVKAVLELAGGVCEKQGIKQGDKVIHAVFTR